MNIKPLDIVSMIGIISSSAISMHIAVEAGKEQKAQKEKRL